MTNYSKRFFLVLCAAMIVILASCDNDDPAQIKKAELSSNSGKWKLTSLKATSNGQTTDVFDQVEDCQKDDIYYFKSDGTIQHLAGSTKCDPTLDPDVLYAGTWAWNDKNLVVTIDGTEEQWLLSALDSKKMVASVTFDFGQKIKLTSTYSKQP